jgi:hypothetical protein
VIVSRNVIWLNKMYGNWKRLEPQDMEYVAEDDDEEKNDKNPTDASDQGRVE